MSQLLFSPPPPASPSISLIGISRVTPISHPSLHLSLTSGKPIWTQPPNALTHTSICALATTNTNTLSNIYTPWTCSPFSSTMLNPSTSACFTSLALAEPPSQTTQHASQHASHTKPPLPTHMLPNSPLQTLMLSLTSTSTLRTRANVTASSPPYKTLPSIGNSLTSTPGMNMVYPPSITSLPPTHLSPLTLSLSSQAPTAETQMVIF